jgi:hypothetical protein
MNILKLEKDLFYGYYYPSLKNLCPFLATMNALFLSLYCLVETYGKKI